MELEKLNKTQIVLVTLLVSFVTSIATGIVTVTLINQTPPGSTYSISKVVERTIEKIVPAKTQSAAVVKTIIEKNKDKIADVVENNTNSIARVFSAPKKYTTSSVPGVPDVVSKSKFLSLAFVLSKDGLLVTDSQTVAYNTTYIIKLINGKEYNARVVAQDEEVGVAILQIKSGVDKEKKLSAQNFYKVKFADSDSVRLGQTVIAIDGSHNLKVSKGIISKINKSEKIIKAKDDKNGDTGTIDKTLKYISSIETDVSLNKSASGSPMINIDGEVIGMDINRADKSFVVPSNLIKEIVQSIKNNKGSAGKKI